MKLAFAALLAVQAIANEGALSLDVSTFNMVKDQSEGWWVMFTAPECTHSQEFAVKWDELADKWGQNGSKRFQVARYDCLAPGNWSVCHEHSIEETPTFIWYPPQETEWFRYDRKSREFTEFILFSIHGQYEKLRKVDEPKQSHFVDEL